MELKDKIVVSPVEPLDKRKLWINGKYIRAYVNGTWQSLGVDLELSDKVDSLDKEVGNHQTILDKLTHGQGFITLAIGNTTDVKNKNLVELKKVSSEDSFFVDINYGFGTATFNSDSGGKAFIITATGYAKMYTIGKDGSVTASSGDINLTDPNTELYIIADELPKTNIKNKIYCIPDKTSTEENQKYIEYLYLTTTKTWEKVGEFVAAPDLSGYAKLTGATFTGEVWINKLFVTNGFRSTSGNYINGITQTDRNKVKENYVYNGANGMTDLGISENFTFTLEDGTTVTKSIRVISTLTSDLKDTEITDPDEFE